MTAAMLGTKLGMTRVFDDEGMSIPVTVISLGPCVVTQVRSPEKDGYAAVQLGYGDLKARNSTIPMIAHDAKAGSAPRRTHREVRVPADALGDYEVGKVLTAADFQGHAYVDVVGTSKGKGTAGSMKRHSFKGQIASHGTERKHRSPGSIGGHATNRGFSGKIKKGKRMAGRLGDEHVTVRSLDVIRLDADNGLLLVKGPVPGPNKATVFVRAAVRLNKSKTKKVAEAAAG